MVMETSDPVEILRKLKYESMLQAAHPVIATAVTERVTELLLALGREDLAREWAS